MASGIANAYLVSDPRRAGARAHLRAMGLAERDWSKPLVAFDIDARRLDAELTAGELAVRAEVRPAQSPRVVRGLLAEYALRVGASAHGAVTS